MTDDILSFSRHIEKSASISPCRNWLESRACQSPPVPASLHGHLLPSSSGCGGWDAGEFCYQSNQSRLSSNQDRESTRSSPAGQHSLPVSATVARPLLLMAPHWTSGQHLPPSWTLLTLPSCSKSATTPTFQGHTNSIS